MERALRALRVRGIRINGDLCRDILREPGFRRGAASIRYPETLSEKTAITEDLAGAG